VEGFFNNPNLVFNPSPMEAKLRELYGIFYRSDLTKAVQEKLFELGYEILIDGRMGSGTKRAIEAFQSDHGIAKDGKVTDELNKRLSVLLATSKIRDLSAYKPPPAIKPSRTATYQQFTNKTALANIKAKYEADKALFQSMEKTMGVPGPLVASIMWIETGYGNYFGKHQAAFSLASMAASANYGLVASYLTDIDTNSDSRVFLEQYAAKRGDWAYAELLALLEYAYNNRLDATSFPGSIYGAIGYGQFMPSNIKKYAADGDGDGKIDLFNKTDAIFSVGRFLKDSGWQGPMTDEEERRKVIMLYNKSGVYVNTVLYVADYLSQN
jgi:membrane-bound lytic murein transglycosylase B